MIKQVDFIGIPVKDMARASQFYKETLGLKQTVDMGDRWAMFADPNGNALMLHNRYAPEGQSPG